MLPYLPPDTVFSTCFADYTFPSASRLPSTPSAVCGAPHALFESFSGSTQLSDFLDRSSPPCSLGFTARTVAPSATASLRISRFLHEKLACMLKFLDHAGSDCLSRLRGSPCCLPRCLMTSAPWFDGFRGSIARPACPLSTLRRNPYGRRRMTRGRCGSLLLHRVRLSLTISRQF